MRSGDVTSSEEGEGRGGEGGGEGERKRKREIQGRIQGKKRENGAHVFLVWECSHGDHRTRLI